MKSSIETITVTGNSESMAEIPKKTFNEIYKKEKQTEKLKMLKSNIELLQNCIKSINDTYVLNDDDKALRSLEIQKEIDEMANVIYQEYGLTLEDLDNLEYKKPTQGAIKDYEEMVKRRKLTVEEYESKSIPVNFKPKDEIYSNNKIAKKLGITSKKENEKNDSSSSAKSKLKERLNLKK